MVVDDDEDEEEGETETEQANLPTLLDQALATAFSLNSASPTVATMTSTSAQAQGPPLASSPTICEHNNNRPQFLSYVFSPVRNLWAKVGRGGRHRVSDETPSHARTYPSPRARITNSSFWRPAERGNYAIYHTNDEPMQTTSRGPAPRSRRTGRLMR